MKSNGQRAAESRKTTRRTGTTDEGTPKRRAERASGGHLSRLPPHACQITQRRCATAASKRHSSCESSDLASRTAAAFRALLLLRRRRRDDPDRPHEQRDERLGRLHDHRPVQLRARRAAAVLLLVSRAAQPRPGRLRLARGVPRLGALPDARLELQLHHLQGLERRVLLGEPVHRLRALLQAHGRPRAAPDADLPGQPRRRGRPRPRPLPGLGQRQAGRGPRSAPARSPRSSVPRRSA